MLKIGKSVFLLCDMQEKFRNAILHFEAILVNSKKLVQAANLLKVPLIVTEQYPKGLGHTVSDIDISHAVGVFPKTKFSMVIPEVEEKLAELKEQNIDTAVLFGIEAHVCVEQTALDLLAKGFQVHVVADATSSRSQEDRLLAFERLRELGCVISTSESVIFKLVGDKENPGFALVKDLVKAVTVESGLVAKI